MKLTNWKWRGLALLFVLPLLAAAPTTPPGLAQALRASRWQHRLLLIGAPTASHAALQQQKKLLASEEKGLAERDFQVLEIAYDQLSPADRQCWTQQLGQSLSGFVVVLIGKDGGVKRTSPRPLAPTDLFGTVDKMPMRRQEMQGKKDE